MKTPDNTYEALPALGDFSLVCDLSNYAELPGDWYIIVADIANSTEAIRSGHYKAVNLIGVSVISSILNAIDPVEVPYIFGGDGASICIPPDMASRCKEALIATRQLAISEFSLDLRIGILPVNTIRKTGKKVLVAKHKVSEYCVQAAFAGGGIEYAESLLKSHSDEIDQLDSNNNDSTVVNYSGLECRWDNVPSKHGETISLIVKALSPSLQEQTTFYKHVIEQIRTIYGDDQLCRPVSVAGLHPTFDGAKLAMEAKLKSYKRGNIAYLKQWLLIRVQNLLGWVLMTFSLKTAGIDWGSYKTDLVANTDFKKFDGVLREVISGTPRQREELDHYLRDQFNKDRCVYGIHYSESALITCLISNRAGNHYHFVDCADGGYALAAIEMKRQLKVRSNAKTV